RYKSSRKDKGSITVEASIVLPLFISVFFILIFMVKLVCTEILLDHAVCEAAKELAASAYPISFINEFEDEKLTEYGNVKIPTLEEELEKLVRPEGILAPRNILETVVSGDFGVEEFAAAIKGILEDYRKGIVGGIVDGITPAYWDMKAACKYYIADSLLKEQLDNPLLYDDKVRLRLVELPQGEAEFSARSGSGLYEGFGLKPGVDFDRNDVVIQVEYDYTVKLPFVKAFNIGMVHTAVEKAWLKGSNGVIAAADEGFDLEDPSGMVVYITRTGIRFHEETCRYLRKSKLPITIREAEAKGYTPCKVCTPLG
ncbi:MAG TPA: TadE family protein, partial [Negativicutes bacterium]|nr:TadE family protein [Negativicutes bacterium]